jgi:chromosome segregation ATPase
MKQDLLLLVARQNAVCHQNAERECEILRQDKANANWRIAELEGDAARMKAEITELQEEKRASEEDLATAQAEIQALQSKLSERGEERRALAILIEEFRDPGIRRDIRSVLAEIAREPETQPTQS